MQPLRFIPLSLPVLILIAVTGLPFARAEINSANATQTRDWPAVALRGYGTLSGKSAEWRLPGGPASILQIHCENADKAKIVHAKYLSDLSLLPGVKQIPGGDVPHVELTNSQEAIAAARSGHEVYIFQASTAKDLAPLVHQHVVGGGSGFIFAPEVEVPMFLDRWDRFGFRFYYGPWTQPPSPPGQKAPPYDFTQDFDFAAKSDRSGLVIWDHCFGIDSAAGQMNVPWWSWAMEAARARQLPVAINDSLIQPLWLTNKYRDQTMFKARDYLGNWMVTGAPGEQAGLLSWSSTTGRDAILSELQTTVRRYNSYPNLVSWLEPDGEIPLTPQSLMTDYGPAADAGYRRFLQNKYHDVAAVSQRWYGESSRLKSWDDIHVPELTHFRGDGPDAIDLAGLWRIGYETPADPAYDPTKKPEHPHNPQIPTEDAPDAWFQPNFDDSAWPQFQTPGNDVAMFLPKRPAVFRRSFDINAATLGKSARWWLYVWDLNYSRPNKMSAWLNGAKVGESAIFEHHWAAFEVTGHLQAGKNQISLRLPNGFIGYRIYLSPTPIRDYPDLGEKMNAEWVDFIEWTYWGRIDAVRRSVEMIRQIDPNRQITFMHPDEYGDGVKEIAEDFGGEFHCTGYMSGFFAELEPMVMRGSDLPASLEPGGPAHDLTDFKNQMGLNLSEGVQGLDYFIHIGDVLWHDDIRANFQEHLAMLHMIGKYHAPKAETAMLIDNHVTALTGYPWGADPNVLLGSGYWKWNVSAGLISNFHVDGLMEFDFARGNAAKYKVILDSNTSIMDDEFVNQIEKYVRNGGIFITCVQTGRHTPTKLNAWPIERLTGYHVTHIDQNVKGGIPETQPIQPAPGQDIFPAGEDWNTDAKPNGLTLEKVAPDCQDLMLWRNGKTAIGMRPLGKGWIIEVGVKYDGVQTADRWDTKPRQGELLFGQLYTRLLDHFKIAHLPATLSEPYSPVLCRHYVSNNGLYDVWTLWNRSKDAADTVSLQFAKDFMPNSCFEIKTDAQPVALAKSDSGVTLPDIKLEPKETRIFVTLHPNLDHAATDWFELQRNWWRGTAPVRKELPPFHEDFTLDLSHDWAFHPLDVTSDVAAMSAPGYDDSKWERRSLGVWGISDHPEVKHALLRKTFTVPANWNKGQVLLWLMSQGGDVFIDKARVFLDGLELKTRGGSIGEAGADVLKPGTTHVIAIDVTGANVLVGPRGPSWLSYLPNPQATIDLSGQWQQSDDHFAFNKTLTFPGHWDGVEAKKTVRIDDKYAGKTILVDFDGPPGTTGVVFNGRWFGHEHSWAQDRWQINVTPWVKFGADNQIDLMGGPINARDNSMVAGVKLDVYASGTYP